MTVDLDRRRASAIALRRALDPAERAESANAVAERVMGEDWYPNSESVGLYLAAGGEIDPARIGDDVRARGRSTWYPIPADGPMRFRRWDGVWPLEDGRFGMQVPPPDEECAGSDLDAVIVPLVLFGPNGLRIGRGGGHYDRTFADRTASGRPRVLCGLAYDFQEDPGLTAEAWDVPLDAAITPTRTIRW